MPEDGLGAGGAGAGVGFTSGIASVGVGGGGAAVVAGGVGGGAVVGGVGGVVDGLGRVGGVVSTGASAGLGGAVGRAGRSGGVTGWATGRAGFGSGVAFETSMAFAAASCGLGTSGTFAEASVAFAASSGAFATTGSALVAVAADIDGVGATVGVVGAGVSIFASVPVEEDSPPPNFIFATTPAATARRRAPTMRGMFPEDRSSDSACLSSAATGRRDGRIPPESADEEGGGRLFGGVLFGWSSADVSMIAVTALDRVEPEGGGDESRFGAYCTRVVAVGPSGGRTDPGGVDRRGWEDGGVDRRGWEDGGVDRRGWEDGGVEGLAGPACEDGAADGGTEGPADDGGGREENAWEGGVDAWATAKSGFWRASSAPTSRAASSRSSAACRIIVGSSRGAPGAGAAGRTDRMAVGDGNMGSIKPEGGTEFRSVRTEDMRRGALGPDGGMESMSEDGEKVSSPIPMTVDFRCGPTPGRVGTGSGTGPAAAVPDS